MNILAGDRNYRNCVAPAVILVGAGDSDETWRALADAMRDPAAIVLGHAPCAQLVVGEAQADGLGRNSPMR
jgi:hypothetical protein